MASIVIRQSALEIPYCKQFNNLQVNGEAMLHHQFDDSLLFCNFDGAFEYFLRYVHLFLLLKLSSKIFLKISMHDL